MKLQIFVINSIHPSSVTALETAYGGSGGRSPPSGLCGCLGSGTAEFFPRSLTFVLLKMASTDAFLGGLWVRRAGKARCRSPASRGVLLLSKGLDGGLCPTAYGFYCTPVYVCHQRGAWHRNLLPPEGLQPSVVPLLDQRLPGKGIAGPSFPATQNGGSPASRTTRALREPWSRRNNAFPWGFLVFF